MPPRTVPESAVSLGTGAERRVVIEPAGRAPWLDWRELWEFRELLRTLFWRDIKVRYKQTVLGASWAVIQPVAIMVVFSLFFKRLGPEGVPYPVFTYTALVPWTYFANALNASSHSLVAQAHMVKKVYFPRLLLPLTAVLPGLLDMAIAFTVLVGLMLWYGLVPTAAVFTLPLFVLLAVGSALGMGLWLSALHVKYRDVRYLLPFLTQIWLFLTPIVYPSESVPEAWRLVYGLNPLAGVVEGFRWALLGRGPAPGPMLLTSVVVVGLLLGGGLVFFRRSEQTFADVV